MNGLPGLDLDHLKTFVEVAKEGNFSRAAAKVFRSQPAVSAQIRQLEDDYQQRLFDRSGKAVRLTPAGEILLQYATSLLRLHDESRNALSHASQETRGVLSIGANEATFLYVLPKVFERFHGKYPSVRISVYRNFSRKIIEKIEAGAVDVGIVTLPVKSTALRVVRMFSDELQLVIQASHPLASKKVVTLAEVAEVPLIFPKTGSTRQVLERIFNPFRDRLRISMELGSITLIKQFVATGFGASVISTSFAQDDVIAGRLRLIPIKDLKLKRELGLVYRKDRTLPRAATAFVEVAHQSLRTN
ncbi:MAG: LysR family transcriptional regulator [Acidobacteria bacterium]|nr:MAG: LysR family transcriptional regulator [Acidobacteriota bacterium]PYY19056.1 MAG: LysR family transcriptional regulator [Acidobacteriota bacterium]